ncbi:hypothetical protein DITRI_Ditri08aG0024300 [Diplodiscus trichospermus]
MYWLATRNVAVSIPRWRSLAVLLRFALNKCASVNPSPFLLRRQFRWVRCFKDQKILRGTARKFKASNKGLDDKDLSHIRLQLCHKPCTFNLVNRLVYSNLLGLDINLKNGSLKEGTLNWEILQFKSKFPLEVLLCRQFYFNVSSGWDFYEAIGIDACILVEYAGLNPFGGLRSDGIPRAGSPVVVLDLSLYSCC